MGGGRASVTAAAKVSQGRRRGLSGNTDRLGLFGLAGPSVLSEGMREVAEQLCAVTTGS